MSHREITVTHNKASNSTCRPASEIVPSARPSSHLGEFPSENCCSFCSFKGSSVSLNGACFLCCNQRSDVCFSQACDSSEVVLCEKIWVQRIPEGDKEQALVLLSARIPAGTLLKARNITFLQESFHMFQLNLPSLSEFWATNCVFSSSGSMVPHLKHICNFHEAQAFCFC